MVMLVAVASRRGRVVDKAAAIIKQHEGCRLTVYKDAAGYPTIGYGHKLLPGERFTTISQAQAEALLLADLGRIRAAVMPRVRVALMDNEWAAVLSFAFNVGDGAFGRSSLLKFLNVGNKAAAAAEFMKWNKATIGGKRVVVAGLDSRRRQEKALFVA